MAELRRIGIVDDAKLGTIMNRIYGNLADPAGRPNMATAFELQIANAAEPYTMDPIAAASIGRTLDAELDEKFKLLNDKLKAMADRGGPVTIEEIPTFLKGTVKGFFQDGLVGDIESVGTVLEGAWKVYQVPSKVVATAIISAQKTFVGQWDNLVSLNFTQVYQGAVDNVQVTGQAILGSELAFATDAVKQAIELNKALTGAQIQLLIEVGKYFEAQMRRQVYKPSPEAETALRYIGLMVADLAIMAVENATPEKLGRLYGWVAYQVVQTVVLDVVSAGAAEAVRAGKLAAMLADATTILRLESLGLKAEKIALLFKRFKSLGGSVEVLSVEEKTARAAKALQSAEALRAAELAHAGQAAKTRPLLMVEGKLAGGCFAPGTMLLTPSGYRAIEDFAAGDTLLTRDEKNPDAPITAGIVARTFRRYAGLMSVNVAGRWLRLTAEHPFWTSAGAWAEAHTLRIGDRVLATDGQWLGVEGVRDAVGHEVVYNLEVRDAHTFFVGAEDWGFAVWVHNLNAQQCEQLAVFQGKKLAGTISPAEAADMKVLEDLLKAEHAAQIVLTDATKALAEQHIKNTGKTVIGPFNPAEVNYIDKANVKDASYFDIGAAWGNLSDAERWAANRHFLDRIADAGQQVYLSIPKGEVAAGSYLAKEIRLFPDSCG